ncbi:MAG: hypothetical protein ACOYOS_04425 [Syntrophales bacterium]
MKKYYSDGGEHVYHKQWWQDVAYDRQKPVIVYGQKREKGGEKMWCAINRDFCLSSEECGTDCPDYSPCNGRNGRCCELKACFTPTGIRYLITEKGSVRIYMELKE